MARRTVRRETLRHMVRIRRSGEVGLVARIAVGRQVVVVVVGVTLIACERGVRACQRIFRIRGVVKGDSGPVGGVVAGGAGGRESCRSVARVAGVVPVRLMAADTGCGKRREVVVGVALSACHRRMRPSQRERRVRKGRGGPRAGCVAHRAIRRVSQLRVVRIGRAGIVGFVTRVTCGRGICVVVVGVTLNACQAGMPPGEWILRIRCVIERHRSPVACVMARGAGSREPGRRVARIRRLRPVCLVAADTCRR